MNEETIKEIIRLAESLLKPEKFCSISSCNDNEPHFHCSECQSKNGHHSQQCRYKISLLPRTY